MTRFGMVPCPICGHQNKVGEPLLLRGGEIKCSKCDKRLTIKNNDPPQPSKVTLRVQNATASKSFDILIGIDGIWQFGTETERSISESILSDSDRAAAVVAGSMVESRLTDVVLGLCSHVPKLKMRHVHPGGALGDFGVKIDLALMLRAITEDAYKDLMTLKDIRNGFAHRTDIQDFNSQWARAKSNNLKLVETHVGELSWPMKQGDPIISFDTKAIPRIHLLEKEKKLKSPKDRYLMTAQLFMICLAPGDLPGYSMPLI